MLCVVFFCKQNTAYELRISDWSSDVCSSDLPCRRIGMYDGGCCVSVLLCRPGKKTQRAHGVPQSTEIIASVGLGGASEVLQPAVGRAIGRESCRERLGQ